MKKFWIIISVCWLWTCGGGGGSPTEPKEPAPVANFTASPTAVTQGQAVTFTSTSTGTITSYSWNVDADPTPEATTASFTHTYEEVGTYGVTLTVTGPGGTNTKSSPNLITVSSAAPTPTTATNQSVQEDGTTTINLTATDPNGQTVTFAITTDPSNGTASLSGSTLTYTPDTNFYGTDRVAYTASNGTYTSDPVTITITVEGEDDGDPTTNDISATTDEDTPVTLTLDATEIDGDSYSFTIRTQPTNGTLGSVNGNQVEYTPNQDFNGTDTFTFEAADDRTFRRNVATATITVNPVNDAPIANDVTASTQSRTGNMRQAVTITLDVTDVDGDDLTYSLVSDVSNGTTSLSGNIVTYTPTANYDGTDTFTYKANDGTVDSNIATGTITITDTNQAPIANDMSLSLDRDSSIEFTLDATDEDGDSLSKTIVSQPENGTLLPGTGLNYTYTPDNRYFGTDSFTYKVNDGTSDSDVKTVSFDIDEGLRRIGDDKFQYYDLIRNNDSLFIIAKDREDDQTIYFLEFDNSLNFIQSIELNTQPIGTKGISQFIYDSGYGIESNSQSYLINNSYFDFILLDSSLGIINEYYSNNGSFDYENRSFAGGKVLSDGRLMFGGITDEDLPLIRVLENSGAILTEKVFEGLDNQYVIQFEEISNGNFFVIFHKTTISTSLYAVLNSDLEIVWSKTFESNLISPTDTQVFEDKVITSNKYSPYIRAIDFNGNLLWEKRVPIEASYWSKIFKHSSGDLIYFANQRVYKFDSNSGDMLWENSYNLPYKSSQYPNLRAPIEDDDGNLIFMLRSHGNADGSEDGIDDGVFKVDINDGTKLLP